MRARRRVQHAPRVALTILSLVAVALAGAGCSDAGSTPHGAAGAAAELRASGFGDHLGSQPPYRTFQRGEWTEHYFDAAAEQAICLGGTEFQVNVRHGASDRVLLYLQGGGACWDHASCWERVRALQVANGAIQFGALQVANPESPFHDHDVVYVPYCDGSLFGGDTTVTYDGVRTYHHGLWNLSVAVDLLAREFPDASQIVIAGSSAGAFGNVPGYAVARVAFPETPIIVFNDSGPGIENHASPAARLRSENWRSADRYPASCERCAEQSLYLLDWALARDPGLRVALFGYQRDEVIMDFFELDADAYRDLVLSLTGEIRARHPERVQRMLVAGVGHTALPYQLFYTEEAAGVAVKDWTRAFLAGDAAWRDVVE